MVSHWKGQEADDIQEETINDAHNTDDLVFLANTPAKAKSMRELK